MATYAHRVSTLLVALALWIGCTTLTQGTGLLTDTSTGVLHGLTVTGTGTRVVVALLADRALDGRLELVKVPPARIFIDLPHVVPWVAPVTHVDRGAVKRVRVALNRTRPLVTRVVLDLDGAATYHLLRGETDRELRIIVDVPPVTPRKAVGAYSKSARQAGDDLSEQQRMVSVSGDRLTVDVENAPLPDLLEEVARQSGLVLRGQAPNRDSVTAKFDEVPLSHALRTILQGQSYGLISRTAVRRSESATHRRNVLWIFDRPEPTQEAAVPFQTPSDSAPQVAAETEAQPPTRDPGVAQEAHSGRPAASGSLPDTGRDEAAENLGLMLADDDDNVRLRAVEALGRIGGEKAAAFLSYAWARDPSPAVRDAAWRTLRKRLAGIRASEAPPVPR